VRAARLTPGTRVRTPSSRRVRYAASTCSRPTNGDSSSSSNGTRSSTRWRRAVADQDLGQLGQIPALERQRSHVDWSLAKRSRSEGGEPLRFLSLRVDLAERVLEGGAAKPKRRAARRWDSPQCKKTPAARVASSTARSSWTGPPSLSERLARHSGATRRRRARENPDARSCLRQPRWNAFGLRFSTFLAP